MARNVTRCKPIQEPFETWHDRALTQGQRLRASLGGWEWAGYNGDERRIAVMRPTEGLMSVSDAVDGSPP
jgi:hypothetical protein